MNSQWSSYLSQFSSAQYTFNVDAQWYMILRRFLSTASEVASYGIIAFGCGLFNKATAWLLHSLPVLYAVQGFPLHLRATDTLLAPTFSQTPSFAVLVTGFFEI
jgi:cytochrome b subunit of formate dehydrogenase